MTCDRCGTQLELIDARFHLRVLRCPACGHDFAGTVSDLSMCADLTPDELVIRWSGPSPTALELASLRQIFPELKDRTITDLRSDLSKRASWSAGRFPRSMAQHLKERVEAAGLIADITSEGPS